MIKKAIVIEILVIAVFVIAGLIGFYVSLVYPPFPQPVSYTEPGKTKLDFPEAISQEKELIPDFLTGAVYRRSELEEVMKERAKVTKLALYIPLAGYLTYLLFRFVIVKFIIRLIK